MVKWIENVTDGRREGWVVVKEHGKKRGRMGRMQEGRREERS